MTRETLLDAVRVAADEPHNGFNRRRKGMSEECARRIISLVLDEVVAMLEAERFIMNAWGGVELLAKVNALRGEP